MKSIRLILVIFISVIATSLMAQCDAGEVEIALNISTDDWGYEVYWEIVPGGNACGDGTIASGGNDAVGCNGGGDQNQVPGGYSNNDSILEGPWCLVEGETYTLHWADDWGDGGATFSVLSQNVEIEFFSGTGNGNSWDFTAIEPPAYDASVVAIHTYSYVTQGNVPLTGEFTNNGTETIQSLELGFTVEGGDMVTEEFTGLNVFSSNTAEYVFDQAMGLNYGPNDVEVSVVSINGESDENSSNDSFSKVVELGNSIPNVIDGYLDISPSVTVINSPADGVNTPRDLDFHPVLTRFELWVLNKGTENSGGSTVRFENAGMPDQDSEYEEDGNNWHFMSLPTGIAFGENENFGTSPGVFDANHDGGTPFTGPSLWSSLDEVYAEPSGGNGSHLDMLHASPRSQGIAHEIDNVYWVVDGHNNDIVRYDFADDHGPGNSYHGDAKIRRFADFEIERDPGDHIVSHCVLDKNTGWLYVVDHGNQRVLRLDINTGNIGSVPNFGPFEQIEEYRYITGYDWEVIVDQDLVEPAGIDLVGNRLLVSDHATGEVIVYDMENNFEELGRVETGDPGIMGIKIGPWGRIWFVNATTDDVGIIEGNPLSLDGIDEQAQVSIYPNPATETVSLSVSSPVFGLNYRVMNMLGEVVISDVRSVTDKVQLDVSQLSSGAYVVQAHSNGKLITSKKLIIE